MSASLKQSLSETLRVSERLSLIFQSLAKGCFCLHALSLMDCCGQINQTITPRIGIRAYSEACGC